MKHYAMVAASGQVKFVARNSIAEPEVEGLTAREVGPDFDGVNMFWDGTQFVENLGGPDLAEVEAEARARRARLLAASDWTQGKDALSRITKPQQAAYAVYRQALCDITDQPGFPLNIQWPARPG